MTKNGAENDASEASEEPAEPEGGETACWADLVCDECGAVRGEGHHRGCSREQAPDGSLKP